MGCVGNFLWFIFGGAILGLLWIVTGMLWCISIVGIPVGLQCFKFASLSFFPFGREVEPGNGGGSLLLNILWLIFGGFEIAVMAAVVGLICYLTIIGIPFGKQHFKIAKLALFPFGATVR